MNIEESNPNDMMMRDTMNQPAYLVEKERNQDKVYQQLMEEFSVLDSNKDGVVTVDEILGFLDSRVSTQ